MADIFFISEAKNNFPAEQKHVSIRYIFYEAIGSSACQKLLVVHALGECDTTSAISGHGKGLLFKKIVHCKKIKPFIDVLQDSNASETEVREASLKLMVRMYGGRVGQAQENAV